MVGKVYEVPPMPPAPEHTRYLEQGPLRIGVEYRKLDPETIEAAYRDNAENLAEIREHSPQGGFQDEGVSIHVESVEDAHEYVRFDVFADNPHYHYVDRDAGTNTIVDYDPAALGEMLPWVLGRVEQHLPTMLTRAGAPHVAERIDPELGRRLARRLEAHLQTLGLEVTR